MIAAAENTSGLVAVSLFFLLAGVLAVAALWYLIVLRPSRKERRGREDEER